MAESTQHKLDRVRPPRVQITYDVEIGNAIEKKELPLVVGILADLSGKPDTPPAKLVERRFVDIDRDNFNEILSSISPRATLQVDNTISGDDSKLNVELRFNHIEDFDPVNLVKQVVPLRRLFEARQRLRDLLTKLDGNDDLDQLLQDVVANTEGLQEIKAARPEAEAAPAGDSEPRPTSRPDPLPGEAAMPKSSAAEQSGESSTQTLSLLDEIIAKGRMAHDDSQQDYARDMLAEFATQVLDEGMAVDKDTVAMINDRISQIDALISDQLNQIIHHPELQKLEASWRGLHQLVSNTETSARLKLRLLNVGKNELQNDLEKAVEFDQSALFKKIYEEEYGTFGGHPFSLLIGDFTFGRHPQDIGLLEKLSNVAAAAHAPFIAAASPRLFDMNSFTELAVPRDLTKIFESLELIKWRAFRERGLALRVAGAAELPLAPALRPGDATGGRHELCRGRQRHRPLQVPLGQRRLGPGAAHHRGLRQVRLVRGDPRRGRRRRGRGPAGAHVPHQLRRPVAEVPDRGGDHRPPREGTQRSRLHFPVPQEEQRRGGVLRRPDHQQGQALQHQRGQRQRAPVGDAAVRAGGIALRPLPEGDHARQGRQLHDPRQRADLPEQLDRRLRADQRQRTAEIKAQYPLREARVDVSEVAGKPGPTAPRCSSGRTSSSRNSARRSAWSPTCRRR